MQIPSTKLKNGTLLSVDDLDNELVFALIKLSQEMKEVITQKGRISLLKNKVVSLVFLEPSSRTILSFQTAAARLGAAHILLSGQNTSMNKGESITDAVNVVGGYGDIVVMRHEDPELAKAASSACPVPYINAGDGGNEHPTQALIDVFTIYENLGRLSNLNLLVGFDALQSRSIHSLVMLLSKFDGNTFTFVTPEELAPPKYLLEIIKDAGKKFSIESNLEINKKIDVVYVNRLQEERFASNELFEELRYKYRITPAMLSDKKCIVMDPLPRVDEVSPECDFLPQSKYFEQARNGVPVRMALLTMMLAE